MAEQEHQPSRPSSTSSRATIADMSCHGQITLGQLIQDINQHVAPATVKNLRSGNLVVYDREAIPPLVGLNLDLHMTLGHRETAEQTEARIRTMVNAAKGRRRVKPKKREFVGNSDGEFVGNSDVVLFMAWCTDRNMYSCSWDPNP